MNRTSWSGKTDTGQQSSVAKQFIKVCFLLAVGAGLGVLAYKVVLQPGVSPADLQRAFARSQSIDINFDGIPERIVSVSPTRAVSIENVDGRSMRILYSLENNIVTPLLCRPDDDRIEQAVRTVLAISTTPGLSPTDKVGQLSAYRNVCGDDALMALALYSCGRPELNQLYGQTMMQYEQMAMLSSPKLYIGAKLLDAGVKGVQDYQKRSDAARLYGYSVENPHLSWRLDERGKYVLADTVPPEAVRYESEKRERQARSEEQRRQFEASVQERLSQARVQADNFARSTGNAMNQAAQRFNQAAVDWQRDAAQRQRQNAQQTEALQRQVGQAAQNLQQQGNQAMQNLNRAAADWQRGFSQWQQQQQQQAQQAQQEWQRQQNQAAQQFNQQLNQAGQQFQQGVNDFFKNLQKK